MDMNQGRVVGVRKLEPHGTNSTISTNCCGVAITDGEVRCPLCDVAVIGYDEESDHARGLRRWHSATAHWKR